VTDFLKIAGIVAAVFYLLVVGMLAVELVTAHALDRRDQRRRLARLPDVDLDQLGAEAEAWLTEQDETA
jgi:hypothetical protein